MDIINGYGTAIDDAENGIVTPNWEFHLMGSEHQNNEYKYRVNIWKAAGILNSTVQKAKDTSLPISKLKTIESTSYSSMNEEDGGTRNIYFIKQEG